MPQLTLSPCAIVKELGNKSPFLSMLAKVRLELDKLITNHLIKVASQEVKRIRMDGYVLKSSEQRRGRNHPMATDFPNSPLHSFSALMRPDLKGISSSFLELKK